MPTPPNQAAAAAAAACRHPRAALRPASRGSAASRCRCTQAGLDSRVRSCPALPWPVPACPSGCCGNSLGGSGPRQRPPRSGHQRRSMACRRRRPAGHMPAATRQPPPAQNHHIPRRHSVSTGPVDALISDEVVPHTHSTCSVAVRIGGPITWVVVQPRTWAARARGAFLSVGRGILVSGVGRPSCSPLLARGRA